MNTKRIGSFLVIGALAVSGCSNYQRKETPDLYPNKKLQTQGNFKAKAAEQYCMTLADEYVKEPDRFNEALKKGAKGAVIGTATGALGGAIMNESAGRGAGAGAAIGGILGVLSSLEETGTHSPSYQRFVERCLDKEGYEVIGWSVKSTAGA